MQKFRISIEGTTPLLMHSSRLANPLDPAAKALAKVTGKRKKTDADYEEAARIEHRASIYYVNGVGPIMPGENINRCLVDAAKLSRNGVNVTRGVFIDTDENPLAYNGPRDLDGLWANENFRFTTTVVISKRRTPRCRPMFREWRTEAEGTLDEEVLNFEQLQSIAASAGHYIGLGDWRPRWGRFAATVEAL